MTAEPADGARVSLRRTFDRVAALYDRVRPGYPPAVFETIDTLTGLGPGARVLEIGCGTGKATLPLAERGYRVTAVELGADLAAFAQEKLARFPSVRIEQGAFEDWSLPAEPFDLVVAAQSFHWLDPATALPKIAAALVPRGTLAVFDHEHVGGGDRALFEQVQACYEQHMPGTPPGLRLTEPDALPPVHPELEASGLFDAPVIRRFFWQQRYTTSEYLDVLRTYSGHLALSPRDRRALFACIAHLIDSFGGSIEKAYVTNLAVARATASSADAT